MAGMDAIPQPRRFRFSFHIAILYVLIAFLGFGLLRQFQWNLSLLDQISSIHRAPYEIRDALSMYRDSKDADRLEKRLRHIEESVFGYQYPSDD